MQVEQDNDTTSSASPAPRTALDDALSSVGSPRQQGDSPLPGTQASSFDYKREFIKIGQLLSATREAKGVSLDFVAAELNIFARHLARLEQGRQLDVAEAYVRGYLKVYCGYLGLNAAAILQRYALAIKAQSAPERSAEPEIPAFVPQSSLQLFARSVKESVNNLVQYAKPSLRSSLSVALPALLLAMVGFAYYSIDAQRLATDEQVLAVLQERDLQALQPDKLGMLASEAVLEKSSDADAQAAAGLDTGIEPPAFAAATAVQQGNVQGLLTVGAGRETPSDARATVPGSSLEDAFEPVGPGAVEMISQIPQSDRLVITVYEDSWIDVRDDTGARLYRNLARAGRRIDISGILPFSLHVGNAPGLELRLNGEPVEIEGYRSDNSARLTVAAN